MVNAAVIIEVIFAWPGIGRLLYEGIFQRDFPLVQGVVVMAGVMIVGIKPFVGILYAFIDPPSPPSRGGRTCGAFPRTPGSYREGRRRAGSAPSSKRPARRR